MRRVFACLCFAMCAHAQDAVRVDPKHFKVEYEDAKIRVVREILPPSETTGLHSHPERVTVVVRGGRLRLVDATGKSVVEEVKVGETAHLDAQTHTVINVGTTTFEEVSTEFKVPAGKLPPSEDLPHRPAPKAEAIIPTLPSSEPVPVTKAPQPTSEMPPLASKPETSPPRPQERPKESVASQLEVRVEPISPIKGAKTVTVNGQELSYLDIGEGDPIVLVHDAATDLRNWAQQIDEFAKHHRVIAYSRRYHYPAKATGREDGYTFKQNVADLLTLIGQLNLGKVHAIGHAYGGAVVALAAMEKPEAFRSIVVMEPVFDSLLPQRQATASTYARDEMLSIVRREFLKRKNPEGAMHSYVDWSRGSNTWDTLSPEAKQRFVDNAASVAAYASHPDPPQFECEQGQKLTMPTLVVRGASSGPNYRIISSTLAECVPGAKSAVVPNATHWMHRESPEDFNKLVLQFVDAVR